MTEVRQRDVHFFDAFHSYLLISDGIDTPPAIGKLKLAVDNVSFLFLLELTELPASKNLRVGNKNFYFDLGSNNRGVYLRISEVEK